MLKRENWFWCPGCERISYDFKCECLGTLCNGGGCIKCDRVWKEANQAVNNNTCPSVEDLIEECRKGGWLE